MAGHASAPIVPISLSKSDRLWPPPKALTLALCLVGLPGQQRALPRYSPPGPLRLLPQLRQLAPCCSLSSHRLSYLFPGPDFPFLCAPCQRSLSPLLPAPVDSQRPTTPETPALAGSPAVTSWPSPR